MAESHPPKPMPFREITGLDLVDVIPKKVLSDKKKAKELSAILAEVEANPGKYDGALISRMRELGIRRPAWIPKEHWYPKEELSPLENVICYMAAWGIKATEVSQNTGCSSEYVNDVLKGEVAKLKVKEIQEQVWGRNPKKWIESILPQAIVTAHEIMSDAGQKGSVRLQAAEGFIDRALGKAQQKIEVNDSSMRKIIERLDSLEQLRKAGKIDEEEILDAEFSPAEPGSDEGPKAGDASSGAKAPKQEDEADRWIRENYPEQTG